jgi:hypothetical protein
MSRTGQLVLAGVLVLWQPLGFATTAGRSVQSLGFRGAGAAIEQVAAGLVAAISVSAAWALWSRAPHGAALARLALVLSAIRSVQSLYWTYLPSDVVPGTERLLTVVIVAHAALWLVYVSRSDQANAIT